MQSIFQFVRYMPQNYQQTLANLMDEKESLFGLSRITYMFYFFFFVCRSTSLVSQKCLNAGHMAQRTIGAKDIWCREKTFGAEDIWRRDIWCMKCFFYLVILSVFFRNYNRWKEELVSILS